MPRKKKTEIVLETSQPSEIVATLTEENVYTPSINEIIETEDVIEFQPDPELGLDGEVEFVADQNKSDEIETTEKELTEEEKRELKILKIKMSHWHYNPKKVFDD